MKFQIEKIIKIKKLNLFYEIYRYIKFFVVYYQRFLMKFYCMFHRTALYNAIEMNNSEIVELLLAKPKININDSAILSIYLNIVLKF